MKTLDDEIKKVDNHYNGVAKAMLVKQGITLTEINEYNILKELARISEKEVQAKKNLKKKVTSMSPPRRDDASPENALEMG